MEQETQNKLKAIELNVESLKQYITLSTFAIAGLLTYYSINQSSSVTYFWVAVGFFGGCTIVSIYNINIFINKIDRGVVNVRSTDARMASFLAIILFLVGTFFSVLFVNSATVNIDGMRDSQVTVSKEGILIGKDYKNKIVIEQDSTTKDFKICIN